MSHRKTSRFYLTAGAIVATVALLTFAFWPKPTMVDLGTVTQGPMQLTIDEEGRTRVHDSYVISAPVAGRLQRVDVDPGDRVVGGHTVVARLLPAPLDTRALAQARSDVTVADAALRSARDDSIRVAADQALADQTLARTQRLLDQQFTTREALETAQRNALSAAAAARSAEAAIASRQADLERARAQLAGNTSIPLLAPVSGKVLSVVQQSAATLGVGARIMEIGDTENDLEVLIELLSTDAVQVSPGNTVLIDNWGGSGVLDGVVTRVEPQGFTKVSALGVEEQRVNTIVRLTDSNSLKSRLGSGFRVEARIVIWSDANATIVPSSALFRDQGNWAVLVVADGKARRRTVGIGRNNGTQAQVLSGLKPG